MLRASVILCLVTLFTSPLLAECDSACAIAATVAEKGGTCVLEGVDTSQFAGVPLGDSSRLTDLREHAATPNDLASLPTPIVPGSLASRQPIAAPRPSPIGVRLAWLQILVI